MATIEALGCGAKLMGQDKWLGGVGSPCGKYIYGVPGHAKDVLRIVVETGEVVNYPPPPFLHSFPHNHCTCVKGCCSAGTRLHVRCVREANQCQDGNRVIEREKY